MPAHGSPRAALFVLAGVVLGGGLSWALMKLALGQVSPHAFLLARLAFATLAAFAVAGAMGRLRWPGRGAALPIVSVAVLQMGAFLWLVTVGVNLVPAGRAALLAYTTPVWVIPLALTWLGERADAHALASIGLGLAGIAVLFAPSAGVWASDARILGNLLLLAGAVVWAVQIVLLRRMHADAARLIYLPWQLLLATALVAALTLTVHGPGAVAAPWTPRAVAIGAYAGVISTTFVFWGLLYVGRNLPAVSSSVGFLGVPAVGLVSAALILGEPVTWTLLAGFVLIAAAIAVQIRALTRRASA